MKRGFASDNDTSRAKLQLGYRLVHRVLGASSLLLRESHRFFRPLGISEVQFNVINVLAGAAEGMSQRELSEVLVVDRSNVTTLLDRMEKAGWVMRSDHPTDRRVYCVTLTTAGRTLHEQVMPRYLEAIGDVVEGVSAAQMNQTLQTLQAIESGVNRWAAEQK
jgi:DNA-binding MarR family transcriptional regulator